MKNKALDLAHPAGEEQFEFVTAGGKIALKPGKEALTPYGGLVPFAAFVIPFLVQKYNNLTRRQREGQEGAP